MRKRVATLTSNVLSPFWLCLFLILLVSFASASSTLDALKWALIAVVLTVLPVFMVILYLVRNGRLDAIFTNVRGQRTQLYLLGVFCAVAGCITMNYLGAPSMLVTGFAAGLTMAVVFMCINLWWKISMHTAFVAASATVLVILYGWLATISLALVPLMAWARIELEYHSLAQVATGALLASLIVVVVFAL